MGGVAKKIVKPIAKLVSPKPPPLPKVVEKKPEPLPEPPKAEDPKRQEEVREKRRITLLNRKGRRSTILTGADGLEDDESVINKKTLLGD